ncbi:hypothetical protein CYLTODRAFT_416838 [Cylindrobasidium torrendii FP15055 ss-10]|uniref:DUF6532 domain-containing protein n=1 Tax=Cylindrobasidium torrendii FP15055 ss-10 TaxID=1314674 RepID=A0A0D7BT77_9AGAR|nr:hypothetical protein CYLTODRAFT_416838 [Cylindrobasidium torrendii FP15055 ss-10]
MSQPTSSITTRAAAAARTSTVTRAQLIARRPGAVTRGSVKVAPATAPATPAPTPAKLAAQRRKEAEIKAAKVEASRKKARAMMADEPNEDEEAEPTSTTQTNTAVATASNDDDPAPPVDVDETLAALHSTFNQQRREVLDEPADDDDDEADVVSSIDGDDDQFAAFEEEDDHHMDADNGPDVFDVTPVAPATRKRRADRNDDVADLDDGDRPPRRKSAKVVSAEFSIQERQFLKHVKNISRAELITENAYHSPYDLPQRIMATMRRTAFDSRYACPEYVKTYNSFKRSSLLSRGITYVDYTNQACRATTVCFVRGAIHTMGIPRTGANAREAERTTVEDVHWVKANKVWQYGGVDIPNRTYDVLLYGQADWVADVASSLLISQRSRLDVDAFAWVMDAQEIPLSLIALILTCGNHVVDEYAGGRWERKPFTVASATTYNEVQFKLRGYELDFPDLVKEWKVKIFEQACEKARKGWLVRTEVAEDGEAVKMMMQEAQAAAARRAGKA